RLQDAAKLGYVAIADAGGIKRYNGLLMSAERRAKGVTFNTTYTWSHCIGPYVTLYDPRALWPYETYTNPNNRDADRGNCDLDRRHLFNLTALAQTPRFAKRTLSLMATGWRFAGIFRHSSGDPLNMLAGTERAFNGTMNERT